MSAQQMQDLLNALENMKDGLQQPGGDEGQKSPARRRMGQGQGQSLALVESFTKPGGADAKDGSAFRHVPGSEHDTGHPDKLFADTTQDAPDRTGCRRTGSKGCSAKRRVVPGTHQFALRPREGRAGRYRDLYEAMAPAAQNTPSSRRTSRSARVNFVRRYFENIRPQN